MTTSMEPPPMAQASASRTSRVLRSASVCSANLRGFVRRLTGPRDDAATTTTTATTATTSTSTSSCSTPLRALHSHSVAEDDALLETADARTSKQIDSTQPPTEDEDDHDLEMEPSPPPSTSKRKKQVTIVEDVQSAPRKSAMRRHSDDEVSLLLARSPHDRSGEPPQTQETRSPARTSRRSRWSQYQPTQQASTPRSLELSAEQKRGCFQHIKRRHSVAMAFASVGAVNTASNNNNNHSSSNGGMASSSATATSITADDSFGSRPEHGVADGSDAGNPHSSHNGTALLWEPFKSKHGVDVFRSQRSRCEVRGVTRVTASVKNVMALLAADDSSESFAHAQGVLLGRDQVIEARVLASCVPRGASRFFHCGLKYVAMKNPFGTPPLDLVFLDYTDVTTTPDGKLLGYRILESIRVPECRPVPQFVRASLRCEVYVVRETETPGVVEVTFASHLDPKSKYATGKRTTWLDQTIVRLANLRRFAEQTTFSHRVLLDRRDLAQAPTRSACFICEASFGMLALRRRHKLPALRRRLLRAAAATRCRCSSATRPRACVSA
ncbi:hypothetical protein PINS_up021264 [Pythium insidiosum]|nr:hypothetical protein PINS_up021264 [Pythium insidiosum]